MGMTQADMAGPPPEAGMPPAEPGMEPPAAGATPEGNMEAMEQERMAQMEAIAQAAPQPEKPYSTALLSKLADSLNAFVTNIDPNMAQIEFAPEGNKWDQPMPPEIFVPLVLVMAFVDSISGQNEGFAKYVMDPAEIVNDAAVRKATSLVQMMAKDQELIDAINSVEEGAPEEEEPMEGELPPEGMEGEPTEMTEDDEALMATM